MLTQAYPCVERQQPRRQVLLPRIGTGCLAFVFKRLTVITSEALVRPHRADKAIDFVLQVLVMLSPNRFWDIHEAITVRVVKVVPQEPKSQSFSRLYRHNCHTRVEISSEVFYVGLEIAAKQDVLG